MEYLSKKTGDNQNAHAILFKLCSQLEDNEDESSRNEDDERAQIPVMTAGVEEQHDISVQTDGEAQVDHEQNPDFDLFEALITYVRSEKLSEQEIPYEADFVINCTRKALTAAEFEGHVLITEPQDR